MAKETIEFQTPVEALVHISKRLAAFETKNKMSSEEFYDKFCKGQTDDSIDNIEWANNYRHYIEIKNDVEQQLKRAA